MRKKQTQTEIILLLTLNIPSTIQKYLKTNIFCLVDYFLLLVQICHFTECSNEYLYLTPKIVQMAC
jgi:hypothetical protein